MVLKKIKNFILDLIFPIKCLSCGKEGSYLCSDCLNLIPLNKNFFCPVCQKLTKNGEVCENCKNKNSLDGLFFAFSYKNEIVKKVISKAKYEFVKEALYPLTNLLIDLIKESDLNLKPDLVIPIPLYIKKERYRGFNQSEVIAKILSENFSWQISTNILKRIKKTKSQTELSKRERKENVKNAFKVFNPFLIKNKNIILIDDIYTTGATLEEAAKTLKKAGAKSVWAITLAKD
jgi:ComF family protein